MAENNREKKPSRQLGPTAKVLLIMAIVVAVPAAYGFGVRFIHFFRTLQADESGRFTIVPMLNYLVVTAGFLCMLGWAIFRGMFHDIEKPKYWMLDNEEKLDRNEPVERSQ
ncbi:MAG: hypothetical protein ACYTHJ_08930 [Planctomycetota bacterium]|jgi:hypothetical protein